MLKGLSLAMKLALGFGIVVTVAVALGLTGFVMFSRVDSNVTALNAHSLPAVKHSTGVERAAFESILQEKNYVLYKKDEIHQAAKEKLASLNTSLDNVDKVAEQFSDSALAGKSKEVRGIAGQYGQLFDEGVAALQKNKEGETTMDAKGELVGGEAGSYMASKKTEYMQDKNALAIVNTINALALETRLNQNKYMLYKEHKYFEVIEKNIAELLKQYDQLEKLNPDATEQKQIADARKATQEYFEAAKTWVRLQKSTAEAEATMDQTGGAVLSTAHSYIANKQKDYEAATEGEQRARSFAALTTGNKVQDFANAAIVHSKAYMLSGKEEDLKTVMDNIDQLGKVYAELRTLVTNEADTKAVDAAEKATQEYQKAANAWVENDKQMKVAATAMAVGGETVGQAAEAYLAAKQTTVDKVAEAVFIVAEIAQEALTTRLNEKGYIVSQDQKYWKGLNEHITKLDTLYDDLRKVSLTADDQQRIERADKATGEYLAAAKSWVENDNKLRQEILPKMKQIGDTVITTAQAAENDAWKQSDECSAGVTSIVGSSKAIITIVLIVGAIIGFVAAVVITRSIARPLKNTFKGLKTCSTQELEETARGFNRIIDSMADGVAQVNDAAAQVSSASQQLAEGASEQASSLEETSSALEQMAAMARTNAANSKQANELATQSHKAAGEGEKTMIGINEASDKISKIIKVIEEIAFQTNLLALNAAVEAARAGEHGKGFAVVAEEVRNLAQRAAQAARETTSLIEDSVNKSRDGKAAIQAIVGGVAKVTELVNAISVASDEQAQGVEQVNTAVSQMDKVTQQNASGAEESASAAEELTAQAASTKALVDELIVLVRGNDAHGMRVSADNARTRPTNTLRTPKGASSRAKTASAQPTADPNNAAFVTETATAQPDDKMTEF